MPGTIQVSILEFTGLPSASASSSIVVKVSLGKQVIETSIENGDFSFPLTTLRDDLVVKVHDNEGNELAHTGVQTRLIVEKGSWDDMFPLEGGGQVHMRLIFLLNDEERHRIRKMRESASKKKQEENPKKELEHSEISLSSDDRKKQAEDKAVVAYGGSSPKPVIIPGLVEMHQVDPSHTDVKEETLEKEASTISDSADSMDSVDKLVISAQVPQNFQQNDVSEGSSLEKDSTNIRKMIVAFESSLSKLEMEPDKHPSIMEPESSETSEKSAIQPVFMELENAEEIRTHAEPETDHSTTVVCSEVVEDLKPDIQSVCSELKNTEEIQNHAEREPDPSTTAMFANEDNSTHEAILQESSFSSTEEFIRESHDQNYSENEHTKITDAVDMHNLEQRSLEDSGGSSTSETNQLLGTLDDVVSDKPHSSECPTQEDSSSNISIIRSKQHQIPHDSVHSTEALHEEECISTRDLLEQSFVEDGAIPSALIANTLAIDQTPLPELRSEKHQQLVCMSIVPVEEIPRRVNKPAADGDSKGPIGQAVKIAVIVGFGLFILLKVQRR